MLKQRYSINNAHILEVALAQKNVLFLTGYFTAMTLASRILLENFTVGLTYRPQNNLLFDKEMCKKLTQCDAMLIKVKDSRMLIKTLKSGVPVWYTPT